MSSTVAGKDIGRIGFGMTSLFRPGTETPREEAIAVMKAAYNAGTTYFNAGELYGTPDWNSLHLLNAYFTKYPEDANKIFVSVKGCFNRAAGKPTNDREGVKTSLENCLKTLDGKCRIDLFQAARGDPDVPIETTVGVIAEYVKAGKVGCVGLSECSAKTIRKASAVHPVGAVEIELSLFETSNLKNGVVDACKEFGISIIAYSPLSRGFLTGQLQKYEDLNEKDFRRMFPRFQPDVFDENLQLVKEVEKVAREKGCSMVQVALAWVSAQSQAIGVPVVPIPGAAAISRVEENMRQVGLKEQELKQINEVLSRIEVKGGRYPAMFARYEQV